MKFESYTSETILRVAAGYLKRKKPKSYLKIGVQDIFFVTHNYIDLHNLNIVSRKLLSERKYHF